MESQGENSATPSKQTVRLASIFPGIEMDTLDEVLRVCDGSLDDAVKMIEESFSLHVRKKKKVGSLYQSSVLQFSNSLKQAGEPNSTKRMKYEPKKIMSHVLPLYTPEDVEKHLGNYVSFYKSFLPGELSTDVLKFLISRNHRLKSHQFFIFDNQCISNHKSGVFELEKGAAKENALEYNGKSIGVIPHDDSLEKAADYVTDFMMTKVLPNSKPLPFQPKSWKCNFCVVNFYEKNSNNMDWHSDRLTNLGPHNFIASISLGATREFRLRRNYSNDSKPTQIYSIFVPHNSLVVMKAGCQEEFKHSVCPAKSAIQMHPISGSSRYNITFRSLPEKFMKNTPQCDCGKNMLLRRSFKHPENRGRYFWSCENSYQNKDCKKFYWADFTNEEGNMIAEDYASCSKWLAPEDESVKATSS